MLWIKAFHVIFVVTWFAGLFYLPRLFVYHAQATDAVSRERFWLMERRLFAIMTIGGIAALGFGLWLLMRMPGHLGAGWMHAKLTLVLLLIGYHLWLGAQCRHFAGGRNRHGPVFYRWINEVPVLFLVGIVLLAVVKPF